MADRDRLVAGPATVYVAATGTAKPVVEAAPPNAWSVFALKQYGDELDISFPQSLTAERVFGETAPIKHFRSEEDVTVSLQVKNLDVNVLSYALNRNAVTVTAAGTSQVGRLTMDLERGQTVNTHALLIRYVSAFDKEWASQIWLPQVVVENEITLPFRRAEATMYTVVFKAEHHDSLGVGSIEMQHLGAQ